MNKYQTILHEQITLDPILSFNAMMLAEGENELAVALYEQSLIVEKGVKDMFGGIKKAGSKVGGSIKDFSGFTAIKNAVKKMLEIIANFKKGSEVDPDNFKQAQQKGLGILKKMGNTIDMAAKNNFVNPAETLRTISNMIKEVTEIFNDFKEIYQNLKRGYESGKKANAEVKSVEKMGNDILSGRKLGKV